MKHIAILLAFACSLNAVALGAEEPVIDEAVRSVHLDRYSLVLGPKVIEGVVDDASGLAFSPATRMLYMAINGKAVLIELNLKGERQRLIRLNGFEDTEGIVWVRDNVFAVLEERRRNLVLVEIGEGTKFVNYAASDKFLIDPVPAKNRGIEGIGYDRVNKRFFIVKEKKPRKIYEVSGPADKEGKADVSNPWDIEESGFNLDDLSGIHYDAGTGHLLILSEESKCIVESTVDGREISRLSLRGDSAGLEYTIAQPEGITMDDKGNLYICSEPNLLYVFSKKL